MTGEYPTLGGPPDPLIGTVLAERYRIERRIGEGGMGAVYLARHVMLEKVVALKILHDEYARRRELVERFLHEAKAASRIRHEHVIDITDFGETATKNVFFAMEYLEGHELAAELDRLGTMPWPRAKKIMLQLCAALQAAHEAGVIHRDLKPENIYLIEKFGNTDFVKVLDFGVAKLTEFEDKTRRLTRTGMVFGTPEYMSPEQARGDKPDARVDVYAAGCMLYEMATGQVPFTGESFMGVLTKHLLDPLPRLAERTQRTDLPSGLQEVIDQALAKHRDERFASMNELAVAIDTLDNVPGITYRAPGALTPERGQSAHSISASHAAQSARVLSEPASPSPSSPPSPPTSLPGSAAPPRTSGAQPLQPAEQAIQQSIYSVKNVPAAQPSASAPGVHQAASAPTPASKNPPAAAPASPPPSPRLSAPVKAMAAAAAAHAALEAARGPAAVAAPAVGTMTTRASPAPAASKPGSTPPKSGASTLFGTSAPSPVKLPGVTPVSSPPKPAARKAEQPATPAHPIAVTRPPAPAPDDGLSFPGTPTDDDDYTLQPPSRRGLSIGSAAFAGFALIAFLVWAGTHKSGSDAVASPADDSKSTPSPTATAPPEAAKPAVPEPTPAAAVIAVAPDAALAVAPAAVAPPVAVSPPPIPVPAVVPPPVAPVASPPAAIPVVRVVPVESAPLRTAAATPTPPVHEVKEPRPVQPVVPAVASAPPAPPAAAGDTTKKKKRAAMASPQPPPAETFPPAHPMDIAPGVPAPKTKPDKPDKKPPPPPKSDLKDPFAD